MPEAAVDKDDGAVFGEDNVGGAWESFVVDTVAETEMPEGVTEL